MNSIINKHISLIGVPMDLGADRRGVDMGPSAIRCAGVEQRLELLGYTVHDKGDLNVRRAKHYAEVAETNLKYMVEIVRVNSELCHLVAAEIQNNHFPLIIGGDHSIAIGTLAGLKQKYKKMGVIWYDAHGDVNTAETSPSGNIHGMALAIALGYGHPLLTSIGGTEPKVSPKHVVLIGIRSLDMGERLFLKQLGIKVYTIHDIDKLGITKVMEEALEIVTKGTDGVHLSLDLDGLDPKEAPGVGTPVQGGMSLRESHLAMEIISDANVLSSAEFVEVNPSLDVMNLTAKVTVELMASLLGEKII